MNNEVNTDKFPPNNLKNIRAQKGWKQEEVCRELEKYNCHISRSTYSKYETGKRCLSPQMIISFALCFGTSTDCILGLCDYKPRAKVRTCINEFCIYYFFRQCLLDSVTVDENGYCENSKYITDQEDKAEIRNKKFLRIFYSK